MLPAVTILFIYLVEDRLLHDLFQICYVIFMSYHTLGGGGSHFPRPGARQTH